MSEFLQFWWVLPTSVLFSTVAISSGVSGALFFSPFFMLVIGLAPVQAVGAGLLTQVFGMGNGLRSYVRSRLVDYATARWLLVGSLPTVIVGALVADRLPATALHVILGIGLVVLASFLVFVRSPEEAEPDDRATASIDPRATGRGTTVISATDGTVYEYPTCWPLPSVALAAVGGLFTGLISAGLAEISTTQLIIRCRVPPRVAVATSVFTLAVVTLVGAGIHALSASPPLHVIGWSVPGVLVGSTIGSRLGGYLPARVMQRGLGIVFGVVGLFVLGLHA